MTLCCEVKGKFQLLDFLVVDIPKEKPALLSGRDAQNLEYLKIYADEVQAVDAVSGKGKTEASSIGEFTRESILEQYGEVFKPGRGKPLGSPLRIEVDPNVKPVQAPRRRVPVAKLDRVNKELKRLCEEDTIAQVSQPTEWLSNMLVREKPDGRIRVCIDPSRTVNKAILRPVYPIPTIEEQLPFLSNAKVFTVVDVSEAFHNIELDYESSLLTTFQGPNGRYRYKRMPFGISSGPEEYQRRQQEFLEGLNGVINIADDICIFGWGETVEEANEDHDRNLIALLNKCRDEDLRLSEKKMQFKLPSVTFMGNKLTDQGVKPDSNKVNAIREMPRPVDKAGVQRFWGMCQYLSKFCQNLSETVLPLRNLLKQNVEFNWRMAQEGAFVSAKRLIASSASLRYYNVKLPVTLQVDASDEAIGGVLMQEGRPVCFTSHTLNKTEKQYAQIEKECLAIVTCMKKWHQYLFGKQNIIVHTDHQPFETIFMKPLGNAPRRLQRMMLQLQQYNFEVLYKRGKGPHIADTLSRAPLEKTASLDLETEVVFRVELSGMDLKPSMSDETFNKVREETRKDPTLRELVEVVRSGWPLDRSMLSLCLRPFWSFKEEITVYKEVLLKSHQVIIPLLLRKEMLRKIHKSHQGPERRAGEVLFWPGMSADIRQVCDVCGVCAQFQVEKPKEPMKSHTVPELPWATIRVDLFQLEGKNYIVMVDHYSDFIEVDYLKNTTANVVIKAMKKNFARHGIPSECISDNGSQFACYEYKSFAKEYGFISVTSSPYYSQGNGKVESAVKVAKNILKKSGQEDPYLALLAYRNTPQQGYTYSPAEKLMSRKLKDIIPAIPTLLQPCPIDNSVVKEDIMKRRKQSKIQYDKKASQPIKNLEVEDRVWIYGKVVGKSNERSYVMQTPLGIVRRNRKHTYTEGEIGKPSAPNEYR